MTGPGKQCTRRPAGFKRALAITTAAVLLFSAAGLSAQSTLRPAEIYEDEATEIEFNVQTGAGQAEVEAVYTPQVKHLNINGPSVASFSSQSFVNGKVTSFTGVKVTYTVQASRPGSYNIPALKIRVNGKVISGTAHNLVVKKGTAPRQRGGIWNMFPFRRVPRIAADSKARLYLQPARPYAGQLFGAFYRFDVKGHKQPVISMRHSKLPELQSFFHKLVKINPPPDNLPALPGYTKSNVEGFAYLLSSWKPGRQIIQNHKLVLADRDDYVEASEAVVDRLAVDIRPLPDKERPAGFYGLVGDFKLNMQTPPVSLTVGETVQVDLTVSGEGNFYFLKDPELQDNRILRRQSVSRIQEELPEDPLKPLGLIRYRYSFTPVRPGKEKNAFFELSWFDPVKQKYDTARVTLPEISAAPDHREFALKHSSDTPFNLPAPLALLLGGAFILLAWLVIRKTGLQNRLASVPLARLAVQKSSQWSDRLGRQVEKKLGVQLLPASQSLRREALDLVNTVCGNKKGKLLERYLKSRGFDIETVQFMQRMQLTAAHGPSGGGYSGEDVSRLKKIAGELK